jgi:hypothetical protein
VTDEEARAALFLDQLDNRTRYRARRVAELRGNATARAALQRAWNPVTSAPVEWVENTHG